MELKVTKVDPDITGIAIDGEMDLYNSHKLKELVTEIYETAPHALILDFQDLSYIDSSGISVLLYIFTQSRKRNLGLWFVNVHGSVRKVIELTSLLGFFPIADSFDEAVRKLS
ncbi:MAG: anti-sigma factor antagonist [Spirochaetes bacterium]|jgi:anti-sigma B factor antagonist|nr:anti-sigma factor antagonist [Spirochaetota bacterium]